MSRFPGLQFPTSNSGQPQTRQQQRPGANLLQRFFAMKGDKLARQGQKFQEDSFNAALEAYEGPDGTLATYNREKTAHDASEKAKYDEAQSRYDNELGTYNSAKTQYDQQVSDYQNAASQYRQQAQTQNDLLALRANKNNYSLSSFNGQPIYLNNNNRDEWFYTTSPAGQSLQSSTDTIRNTIAPITTPMPTEVPSFSAATPKFDYTTTAFGSDVPSFEYVAPESPGSRNLEKLGTMGFLADQLQEVLPENSRNRNRNPTSFYNIF